MKTKIKIVFAAFVFFFICNQINAQLKVTSTGNVGIGYNYPSTKLWVEGTTRFGGSGDLMIDWTGYGPTIYPEIDNHGYLGKSNRRFNHGWIYCLDVVCGTYSAYWTQNSDRRIKDNIQNMYNVLPNIKKINTYTYNFNKQYLEAIPGLKSLNNRKKIGFIAQELNEIFPELVYANDTGLLSIDYISMIPILTQAIKEQQILIDNLQNDIITIKKGKADLQISKEETYVTKSHSIAILYQNAPNPFNLSTEINYYIPESINSAYIYLYNMNGSQIKSIPIQNKGNGNVAVNGSELQAGMYIYTLVVDNQEIDSKHLILTK